MKGIWTEYRKPGLTMISPEEVQVSPRSECVFTAKVFLFVLPRPCYLQLPPVRPGLSHGLSAAVSRRHSCPFMCSLWNLDVDTLIQEDTSHSSVGGVALERLDAHWILMLVIGSY